MIEKIWTAHESGLLLRLERSELTRIEYQSRARSLPPDSYFPFPEESKESAFAIASGRAMATYFANGRTQPIRVELTPGDFFGIASGHDSSSIGKSLILSERSTVIAMPREILQNALNAQQRHHNRVLVVAGWIPQRFSQPLVDNFFVSTQKRLARFLYDQAFRRADREPIMLHGMSDGALATLMNSAPQLISGCLEEWEEAGIVSRQGNRLQVMELGALAEAVRLELREPIRTNGNTVRVGR